MSSDEFLEIPWQKLSPEALEGMLDELVSRDGTDYGEVECSQDEKRLQLREALEAGRAVIAFCPTSESWTVLPRNP